MSSATPQPVMFAPPPPPTQPGGFVVAPRPTSWPKVLGIICIILGAGGLILNCMGVLQTIFADKIIEMTEGQPGVDDEATQAALQAMKEYKGLNIAASGGALAASLMLLVCGIKLVSRTQGARGLCIAWSWFKLLVTGVGVGVGYMSSKPQLDAMSQDPSMSQVPAGFMDALLPVLLIVVGLWGIALPIFMLIWMSRGRIKSEVASWQA